MIFKVIHECLSAPHASACRETIGATSTPLSGHLRSEPTLPLPLDGEGQGRG